MSVIDPHSIFPNGENVDLASLTMFAELKVIKRNRISNSSSSPIIINFLGQNDNGYFTTDFTENSENFGITEIQYRITSSYVPQVDITFKDVRGQSLFNDSINSKYKVLFDMPPPLFELTLKGYYGQSVTYKLHLLKNNVSWDEGNYVIKSNFIGMTFAPLSDMLFDYLEVAPFLKNTDQDTDINTTIELRTKAKDLVAQIKSASAKDVEYLQDKSSLLENLKTYENKDYINEFVNNINSIITGNKGQNNEILAKREGDIVKIGYKWYAAKEEFADQSVYEVFLNKVNDENKFFSDSNIQIKIGNLKTNVSEFKRPDNIQSDEYIEIIKINLTDINQKIAKSRTDISADIVTKQYQTKDKVQAIVLREIKGGPTLKNVLRILFNDANTFIAELQKVVLNAAAKRKGDETKTYGEAYKYPFPNFYKDKSIGQGGDNRISRVKTIPTNEEWDEVQFVNRYINAKIQAKGYEEANDISFDSAKNGVNNWVPINPFDSLIINTKNIYNSVSKSNLFEIINSRAAVITNATFEITEGNLPNFSELIKIYGKLEGYNIINSLKANPKLLSYLINEVNSNDFDFGNTLTLINSNRKGLSSVNLVEGASVDTTYSGGEMILLKTIKEWEGIGGIPQKRTDTTGSDELTNSVQSLVKNIESGFIERVIRNQDKLEICQYNVPFFKDTKLKNNDGSFSDKSDFCNTVSRGSIFSFLFAPDKEEVNTPDNFLNLLFQDYLYSPFEMERFRMVAAIHEVPFFVLAYWGYLLVNIDKLPLDVRKLWNTIPQKMVAILKQKYSEYVDLFNGEKVAIQSTFLTKMIGGFNFVHIHPPTDFYVSPFMQKFTESFYLVLGETKVFTSDANKTINFIDNYNLTKSYYDNLKTVLKNNKNIIDKEQQAEQKQIDSKIKDIDLRTELYYSFKSFVDKWLLDSVAVDFTKLFDVEESFLMVDRAFNNIGDDVMLDLTPLYSTETSVDTSLYTLILNLLSKNNFEFFSLPTYISYKDQGILWNQQNLKKIFGTSNTVTLANNPKFICMYVGGTSAQLDMPKINNDSYSHENDGGNVDELKDLSNSNSVQAFSVKMGTGSQSFFKNIELDQAEFKETNESIKLLDRIANSQDAHSTTTEVKSNNLYNVFQQRSYTAKVHTLGNMMIQPTMYFQLENISMWKGAYLITEVNHSITAPNLIETNFVGVRVPQYTKPYIDDYAIIANLDLGSPLSTSLSYGSNSGISKGRGVSLNQINDIKSSLRKIGNNANNKISPKEKALLDVVSFAEGTLGKSQDGYDVLFSNKLIPTWSPAYPHGHGGDAWKNTSGNFTSTAAGRYQFLYERWKDNPHIGEGIVAGDNDNKPFTLTNQDLKAAKKIEQRFQSWKVNIENINHDNFINYVDVLALEWASFPFYGTISAKSKSTNWSVGKGYYDGQGGRFTVDELWIVYSLALKKYLSSNPNSINLENELTKLVTTTITPAQAAHIATLHPSVQSKFTNLITAIQQQTGYQVNITDSYRTYGQQVSEKLNDKRNAVPGTSLHGFGLAVDINLIRGTTTLYKNSPQSAWLNTGAIDIAKNLGFVWGGEFTDYKDNVHFEVTNNGERYSGSKLYSKAQALFGTNISNSDLRKINLV